MRCYPEALAQHLKKGLSPLYLLYGSESFLVEESASLVRKTILSSQDVEHVSFTVEQSGSSLWQTILSRLQYRSLFSEKQLIEIRFLSPLGQVDTTHLLKLIEKQSSDTFILLHLGQLTRQQSEAKWFVQLQQKGLVVQYWPLSPTSFLKWIKECAKQQGLQLTNEALSLLSYYTEGNCLAAKQEIERLTLYYADLPEVPEITQLEQQSQFQVFDLATAMLQQQPTIIIKIMQCLRNTGTAPQLIIWMLAQTLRVLLSCLSTAPENQSRALQRAGIRVSAQPLYLQALKALTPEKLSPLLSYLSGVDKQLKTGFIESGWSNLLAISLVLAGIPLSIKI